MTETRPVFVNGTTCPECDAIASDRGFRWHSGVTQKADGYRGFVHFSYRGVAAQLFPEEARNFAWQLLQVAEAALSDEAVFGYAKEHSAMSDDDAAECVRAFRKVRWKKQQ